MSLKIEGRKCVVCQAYLFEEDDIVFCPDCGAPHHRDCWAAVGKCGMSGLHGTPDEYKFEYTEPEEEEKAPEKQVSVCRRCSKELEDDAQFCPYCGAPNSEHPQMAEVMHRYTGDPDEELDGGITTQEVARVVAANTARYIPKFRELGQHRKLSWNWAAFLLPHGWFAFRKMYGAAFLTAALMIASTLLTLPMLLVMDGAPVTEEMSRMEAAVIMSEELASAGFVPMCFTLVSTLINLAVRMFSAAFADWIYKGHVLEACSDIREADDRDAAVRKLGGVSTLAFAVAVFAVYFLPNLIAVFI